MLIQENYHQFEMGRWKRTRIKIYSSPIYHKKKFTDYYEPFVGGGAVYTAIQATNIL
jgi:site-specific DNA-adenine methylase